MKRALLALVAFVGFAGAAWSADVEVRYTPGALSFSGGTSFTNAVLEIRGPNDFEAVETASRGLPVFRVRGGKIRDGFYQFSLSAATDEKVKLKKQVDNGRGQNARDYTFKPFYLSGVFQIERGTLKEPAREENGNSEQGDDEKAKD